MFSLAVREIYKRIHLWLSHFETWTRHSHQWVCETKKKMLMCKNTPSYFQNKTKRRSEWGESKTGLSVSVWLGFLLSEEEGGIFSAPREGDGKELQCDVHFLCPGGQLLRLETRKVSKRGWSASSLKTLSRKKIRTSKNTQICSNVHKIVLCIRNSGGRT